MKRNKPTTGIAFDRTRSLFLCYLAAREGIDVQGHEYWKDVEESSNNQLPPDAMHETESNLLSSILIFGGVHLLLSNPVQKVTNFSLLEEHGIKVGKHVPYDTSSLEKLQDIYGKVFAIARFLEQDSRIASLISLDGSSPRANAIEFSTQLGEYEHYCRLLSRETEWVWDLSPELFVLFLGNALQSRVDFAASLGETYARRRAGDHKLQRLRSRSPLLNSVFDAMSLDFRGAAELDAERGGVYDLFPEDYFKDFGQYDADWGELESGDWETEKRRVWDTIFCHPKRFGFVHSYWRTWFEIKTLIHLSSSIQARIGLPSLPSFNWKYPISKDERKIQLYRLYVNEINAVPRITNFRDLFRLYNHKYVSTFRNKLDEWNQTLLAGDANALKKMRRDFELATKDLRTVAELQKVGNILTVVALPVAIAGLLTGLPLDFAFTAVGPALLAESWRTERRASWVRFGDLN